MTLTFHLFFFLFFGHISILDSPSSCNSFYFKLVDFQLAGQNTNAHSDPSQLRLRSIKARNLQRPELDWRKAYHFNSERDARVFTADPITAVQDPPLSFVHSITACGYAGEELRIMLYVFLCPCYFSRADDDEFSQLQISLTRTRVIRAAHQKMKKRLKR